MSDVIATYGLDYGDYRKGLADIDRTSARHFAKQEKASLAAAKTIGTAAKAFIGGNVIQSAVRLATGAIRAFAEESPEAARALDSISNAGKRAAAALGQDLFYSLNLAGGEYEKFSDRVSEEHGRLTDMIAAPFRERLGDSSVEELNAARAAELDSQKFSRFQREYSIQRLETQAAIAEATGQDASVLRERARHRRAQAQIGAITYAPERDAKRASEEELHQANMQRIQREAAERAAADDRRAEADRRRMEMEQALVQIENKELDVAELRARGREREADAMQLMVDAAREAARIHGDPTLTAEERAERIGRTRERHRRMVEIERIRRDREEAEAAARSSMQDEEEAEEYMGLKYRVGGGMLESGLGGRADLRSQVFGHEAENALVRESKLANKILADIRDRVGRPNGAVFS